MFIINKISRLSERSKEVLYKIAFNILAIIFFFLLILSILKTNKLSYIHISPGTDNSILEEPISEVMNLNVNNELLNPNLETYLNNLFITRNNSILNGDIEQLYNFYDKSNKNSIYSLIYELKRISYIRDWSIERSVIFTSLKTDLKIKDIKTDANTITLKLNENTKFNYIYSDNKNNNTFDVNLVHTITLIKNEDMYVVEKDYYLDFLGDEKNSYKFNLNETDLPYNKSINKDFIIEKNFTVGDVLSYYKYNFIDHKAVVSSFDSKGYPLINSTTVNCTNLPYDFGWKSKNIKID